MSDLKNYPVLELSRNLRRSILRGAPWIYKEALHRPPQKGPAHLAELRDKSGFLAWVLADPLSPLAARVLSLERSAPDFLFFKRRLSEAIDMRRPLLNSNTDSVRWIHGEGDSLPGLIVDLYGSVAVVQMDGPGPEEFWSGSGILEMLAEFPPVKTVVVKPRRSHELQVIAGTLPADGKITIVENGARFLVPLKEGQKTGFFLDQRDNRYYAAPFCGQKSVLNLFSYTGGFSIFAGLGGASHVTSLDSSQGALQIAQENWLINNLHAQAHETCCEDAFQFLENARESWQVIFVDPPSMTHAKTQKEAALKKYIETFTLSLKRLAAKGDIFFSSCSSRITPDDFLEIIDQSLSAARRSGKFLRISSQSPDHPFPHAARELQYLKFAHLRLHN